ncbi:MAG: hypothetical protein A2X06_12720 [Bacteroidetes bacterium GWC2_40_22]|nr:MAG: hypothetical protein A2X06_12720 [Bacteroidetes bacterium GWC2_40_22]
MRKSFSGLFMALIFLSSGAYSQFEEKLKEEGVVAGSITRGGKEIQGYIKETGTAYTNGKFFPAPWQFQSDIKFIAKDIFEKPGKIKNKLFEKYGAKDIEGYRYDTLVFESVKYLGVSDVIPKTMFVQSALEGKISLYYHFNSPPPAVSGPEGFEPVFIECSKPNLVYQKDNDGIVKLVKFLNIEKELADCPYVTEKQRKGEYQVVGKVDGSSFINKLIKNTVYREQVRLLAIEDYNNNCR